MLYTSGTTGQPKGVPRSHRADRAGGLSQVAPARLPAGRPDARRDAALPHDGHPLARRDAPASAAASSRCARWDAGEALALIERERITSLYLAPTLFHDLVHHPRVADHDLSSVRALGYAGAAMTSRARRALRRRLRPGGLRQPLRLDRDLHVLDRSASSARKPGCAGRPALNARLELRGRRDLLPPGLRRGLRRLLEPARRRRDGDPRRLVLTPATSGRLDEDGDLWVEGRVDDMIICGGENVHPLEIEDVLARHPGVRGGRRGRRARRPPRARVWSPSSSARRPPRSSTRTASPPTLARFKRPREYRFVETLPKSPSGKILRRMLRDEKVSA